jgi:hypothetical protein
MGEDKKAGDKYYEVACNEGMGFAMIAKKDRRSAGLYLPGIEPTGRGRQGRRPGLPAAGQRQPRREAGPYVQKAGVTCDIENTRAIGSGAKNSFFEVACKGGAGYIVQTTPDEPERRSRRSTAACCTKKAAMSAAS